MEQFCPCLVIRHPPAARAEEAALQEPPTPASLGGQPATARLMLSSLREDTPASAIGSEPVAAALAQVTSPELAAPAPALKAAGQATISLPFEPPAGTWSKPIQVV